MILLSEENPVHPRIETGGRKRSIPMKRYLLPVLVMFTFLGVVHADDWKKTFRKDMADYDHDVRVAALQGLDTSESKQFDALVEKGLKDLDWWVRLNAQKLIAKIDDEKQWKDLIEMAEEDKDFPIREGIVAAMGMRGERSHVPHVVKALQDEKVHVREAAARSLARFKVDPEGKDCIEALIQTLENEDEKYRVKLVVVSSLETLTDKILGNDPRDWRNWWEVRKDQFSFEEPEEEEDEAELEKAKEAGHKAKDEEKTVAGVRLKFRVKGAGAPVVVIPTYGYNGSYMEPFLDPLTKHVRVYYCDLPPASSYENLKRSHGNRIHYPVDQLCDAFKKWLQEAGQQKIGLMADQRSCWVAMRFATKYPQHLSYMILLSPVSGVKAQLKGIERVIADAQKKKNLDLEHHAQSHLVDQDGNVNYQIKDREEFEKFEKRIHFTEWWYRQYDSTIEYMRHGIETPPDQGVLFTGFEMGKEKRALVPTLIIWGKKTPRYSKQDANEIRKFYRNSELVVFDNSAKMTFVEEHEKFIGLVKSFIKKRGK
jgi:pimeloyl-ACP methyl ester carboxylesterase